MGWSGRGGRSLEDARKVSERLFGQGRCRHGRTVAGWIPAVPELNTKPPATIAWLYGAERCREQAADYGLSGLGSHLS